jgi:hypothetical protein
VPARPRSPNTATATPGSSLSQSRRDSRRVFPGSAAASGRPHRDAVASLRRIPCTRFDTADLDPCILDRSDPAMA